jgi:uncharacterized protein (TIGR00299 family) protein
MRAGLLDLPSGLSGDMFLAALIDAGASLEAMERAVRAAGGNRLSLRRSEVMRGGLRGVRVEVMLDGEVLHEPGGPVSAGAEASAGGHGGPEAHRASHGHRPYRDIARALGEAALDPPVKETALRAFALLGEAEARLHGTVPDQVHFHEVGSLDAVADVVGTAAGVASLGLERLYHGPVAVGGGTVGAAHGTLPVPAPATLEILTGRELRFEPGAGELTTPTGAALLAALAEPLPAGLLLRPERTGYGAGRGDPAGRANLARLTVGEVEGAPGETERVAVVEASLDDLTPEDAGHLMQILFEAGALDVTLSPLLMKKSRPGFLLRVIAEPQAGPDFATRVVRESTSLGARWRVEERTALPRRVDRVRLPEGEVRVKVALLPGGGERPHAEFEDVAAVARSRGVPPAEVRREVEEEWRKTR